MEYTEQLRDRFAETVMRSAFDTGSQRCVANLIREEHDDMTEEQIADAANDQIARMSYRMADAMLRRREIGTD